MVKIKKLRWGGNIATTPVCRYDVDITADKRWKVSSPTFMWFPAVDYKSRKAAQDACQRHFENTIYDLLEDDDEPQAYPSTGAGDSGTGTL